MESALWLLGGSIVIASYLIGKSLKESAEINRRSTPEYRQIYENVNQYLDFERSHIQQSIPFFSKLNREISEFNKNNRSDRELEKFEVRIKRQYQEQEEFIQKKLDKFDRVFPEKDLYDPRRISFNEWPAELQELYKNILKVKEEHLKPEIDSFYNNYRQLFGKDP